MSDSDYDADLLGFISRSDGIPEDEWLGWACACQKLRRHEPRQLKNPFKPGTFVTVRSSMFFAIDNEGIIGILAWEESECISVFGSNPRMDAFVIQVCAVFNAEFERLNSNA
jgi:hypothetical protein